jgi:hypothetical protein
MAKAVKESQGVPTAVFNDAVASLRELVFIFAEEGEVQGEINPANTQPTCIRRAMEILRIVDKFRAANPT